MIGGRTFVNNASFGAYAEIVQSPEYRDDKTRTTLNLLPDHLAGHRGARLSVHIADVRIDGPQAVLVSNDPYGSTDLAGLGRRARLDHGVLGIVAISVGNARQAVGLLRRRHQHGLHRFAAAEVVVDADSAEIPVGIDGEAILMPTPVRCTTRPSALRVRRAEGPSRGSSGEAGRRLGPVAAAGLRRGVPGGQPVRVLAPVVHPAGYGRTSPGSSGRPGAE